MSLQDGRHIALYKDPVYVKEYLEMLGFIPLSEYTGINDKMRYVCTCFKKLKEGQKCGKCAQYNFERLLLSQGKELVKYVSCREVHYICCCGSAHVAQVGNYLRQHQQCPNCRTFHNKVEERQRRKGNFAWRMRVLKRDNYTCRNPACMALDNLHVHHIEAYVNRPDLRDVDENGLTLCSDCHYELHGLFGVNVGIYNLERWLNGTA